MYCATGLDGPEFESRQRQEIFLFAKSFRPALKFSCNTSFLYGCETWSLILREVCRLLIFENRVLRKTFGSKKDEVTGGGEDYKVCDMDSSPNIIRAIKSRRMRWVRHVARMRDRISE